MSASTTWLPWILKFLIGLLMAWLSRRPSEEHDDEQRRVQIVVLGDIGRSPRMQYHALSILKHGGHVDFIGYQDSLLHPSISATNDVEILPLPPFPSTIKTNRPGLFLMLAPLKVIFQVWTLWSMLQFKGRRADWMLVQTPPSIPTLAVALLVCRLRNTRLVIDWHNFGYSILALKLGQGHLLVHVSRLYEQLLSRFAHTHLCVADAMARVLKEEYHITAPILTLHDRPASTFQILDDAQRTAFLDKLPELVFADMDANEATEMVNAVKLGNTKLLVSSTSWTADEDFSLLLEALVGYAGRVQSTLGATLPELLVIVTGKGPQKRIFEDEVAQLHEAGNMRHITIKTAYFDSIDDYAKLLGCADLGISLHTSSSGVDLPMKVVDMFGAGLPVVGWGDFEAWPELVKEGFNGMTFNSAAQLGKILENLFRHDSKLLVKLRRGALEEGKRRWDHEWDSVAGDLFGFQDQKTMMDGKERRRWRQQ
ncbi:MAG: hypothetical protein Q9163_002322 [Psora crenata]